MKGKHAVSSAARQAIQSAESQVETYQAAVRRLTAENKLLREQAKQSAHVHSQEIRRLKAERNAGVSPALHVAEQRCRSLQDDLDKAKRNAKKYAALWEGAVTRVAAHMAASHPDLCCESPDGQIRFGLSAAGELMLGDSFAIIPPDIRAKGLSDEMLHALVRSRGGRV